MTYRLVVFGCRVLFAVLGLRIEVRGAERVPLHGPAVLAANHQSFLDFMLVGLVGRRRHRFVRFLAKQAVLDAPVVGAAMRAMGHLGVDRTQGVVAARQTAKALARGELAGIYPEATIGRAFTVRERPYWRRGAAYLALATGAPLVPVAQWGAHRVLTAGPRWSLRRGVAVVVQVGPPLEPRPGETADQLTDRLHETIAAMVDDLVARYPQPPRTPASTWWWPAARGGAAPWPRDIGAREEQAVAGAKRPERARRLRALPAAHRRHA